MTTKFTFLMKCLGSFERALYCISVILTTPHYAVNRVNSSPPIVPHSLDSAITLILRMFSISLTHANRRKHLCNRLGRAVRGRLFSKRFPHISSPPASAPAPQSSNSQHMDVYVVDSATRPKAYPMALGLL